MKRLPFILLFAAFLGCSQDPSGGYAVTGPDGREWKPMSVERLPDLPQPRGGHRTIVTGDEIVLLGGLTDGYKPLETAEYYADGSWHTVSMLYTHINGFLTPLQDGRYLLGGGSQEAFGIGQSWGAEVYDPASHSFLSVGIMSDKRAQPSAITLPDGKVVIAGNWYADDSFETWTPEGGFLPGGPLTPGWVKPYLLPASPDDILILGPLDTRGGELGSLVGHIGGGTEKVPLFEEWALFLNEFYLAEDLRMADYTYLLPVWHRQSGQAAILKVEGGAFSLLEMDDPLPMLGPREKPILWGGLQVDRPSRLIWMQGQDGYGGMYFARINYDATFDGGKASATLFYADAPGFFPYGHARLLPGGRLIVTGGLGQKGSGVPIVADFFKAYSSVYIFHSESPVKGRFPYWIVLAILLLGGGMLLAVLLRNRRKTEEEPVDEGRLTRNLMEEMSALIEEKELWKRKDLRVTDIASELATNKTYISILLNNLSGTSFTDMVNGYRIRHAQQLMREHPDMLLEDVASESGFSSYITFYRNFKAITGLTPQEWKKG